MQMFLNCAQDSFCSSLVDPGTDPLVPAVLSTQVIRFMTHLRMLLGKNINT